MRGASYSTHEELLKPLELQNAASVHPTTVPAAACSCTADRLLVFEYPASVPVTKLIPSILRPILGICTTVKHAMAPTAKSPGLCCVLPPGREGVTVTQTPTLTTNRTSSCARTTANTFRHTLVDTYLAREAWLVCYLVVFSTEPRWPRLQRIAPPANAG